MTKEIIRTYSELITYTSFEDRVKYLSLKGNVGEDTFGFDRIFNQIFYHSPEWRSIRKYIITRDMGRDLGYIGHEILEGVPIYIHHMNPINIDDIKNASDFLLNPEYLITTIFDTHKIIHYGKDVSIYEQTERVPNDTCPWKKGR